MYDIEKKEFIKFLIIVYIIFLIITNLFFNLIIGVVLSFFLTFYFRKNIIKTIINSRKWQLNLEFKEFLNSISNSMIVGYTLENSIINSKNDIKMIYKHSFIEKEIDIMINKLNNNISIETILMDFANKSDITDIKNFVDIIIIARKKGGNMVSLIHKTSESISSKIELKKEQITILTTKKFELVAMNIIPLIIILYLKYFSNNFIEILYKDIRGIITMSICFFMYILGYILSERIMDIDI